MWKYRGIKVYAQIGDKVKISKSVAKANDVSQYAEVTDLRGFITVRLSDNSLIDLITNQVSFLERKRQ